MLSPPLPSFRLDGKKALITGAGRGIGAAAAAVFAQAGAAVMLCIFIFDMSHKSRVFKLTRDTRNSDELSERERLIKTGETTHGPDRTPSLSVR